ncbi:sugar phosphate nucleotidyltransferase [Halomonas sp. Alg239-R46]|uniref:sugar phosphate nucleotidyltransferase n=1 Tax=Halomonas sp. Alg239-R46 TaxID=2993445 RepID=UPI00248D4324|nr:sugar phosphate nucleotidyltransferase [Halomonas sp. Alg239-R46]
MQVRKAIIPVAGFGTRLLPISKAIPKEMVPVVDRPLKIILMRILSLNTRWPARARMPSCKSFRLFPLKN